MNDNLDKALEESVRDVFMHVDKNFTKHAARIRLLKLVFDRLETSRKDLEFLLSPETVFVHPQVSDYLADNFPADSFIDEEDRMAEIVRKFYSADYHHRRDAEAFADVLDREVLDPVQRKWVNFAFGVDGFRGEKLRSYVDNLGLAMKEEHDWERGNLMTEHVRVVRDLYQKFGPVKVELVHMAIQNAFDGTKSANLEVQRMADSYAGSMGEVNLEKAKIYIESKYMCHFENPGEAPRFN